MGLAIAAPSASHSPRGREDVHVEAADKGIASRAVHRFVETNGIRMHIAEQGSGGRSFCSVTGFRNRGTRGGVNLKALADAGYTEIALQIVPSQEHAIEDWGRIRRAFA